MSKEPAAVGSRRPSPTLRKGYVGTRHSVGALAERWNDVLTLSPPDCQGDRQNEIIMLPFAPGPERFMRACGDFYAECQHFLDEQGALRQGSHLEAPGAQE